MVFSQLVPLPTASSTQWCDTTHPGWVVTGGLFLRPGGSLPSVNDLSLQNALATSSVSFRRWVSYGYIKEKPINRWIGQKFSAANYFNKDGKLDHQLFEIWVSCKRNLWKTMQKRTKCCKLSRSTDCNDLQTEKCQVAQMKKREYDSFHLEPYRSEILILLFSLKKFQISHFWRVFQKPQS